MLGYGPELSGQPLTPDQWLAATADHAFPDAPVRLWDAFHGRTQQTPQVMVSVKDGFCAGIEWFQWFVNMHSSHGGINQINSAAFVTTMRPSAAPPAVLRSRNVMDYIQPGFRPPVVAPVGTK